MGDAAKAQAMASAQAAILAAVAAGRSGAEALVVATDHADIAAAVDVDPVAVGIDRQPVDPHIGAPHRIAGEMPAL